MDFKKNKVKEPDDGQVSYLQPRRRLSTPQNSPNIPSLLLPPSHQSDLYLTSFFGSAAQLVGS